MFPSRKFYERLPQNMFEAQHDDYYNPHSKSYSKQTTSNSSNCICIVKNVVSKWVRKPFAVILMLCFVLLLLFRHQLMDKRISFATTNKQLTQQNLGPNSFEQTDKTKVNLDLLLRTHDLLNIKNSFMNELVQMEKEKDSLEQSKETLQIRYNKLVTFIQRSKLQLKQLDLDMSSNRRLALERVCATDHPPPILFKPLKSENLEAYQNNPLNSSSITLPLHNNFQFAFDFSLCPLSKDFKFTLVSAGNGSLTKIPLFMFDKNNYAETLQFFVDELKTHPSYVNDAEDACLAIVLNYFGKTTLFDELDAHRNNFVINFDIEFAKEVESFQKTQSKAIIASPVFHRDLYRHNIDVVMPSILMPAQSYDILLGSLPTFSPIERKYLASYFANSSTSDFLSPTQKVLRQTLSMIRQNSIEDWFLFKFDCGIYADSQCLLNRESMIEQSSFLVITPPNDDSLIVDPYLTYLLHSALSKGTVPVIVGHERVVLPFQDVLDWRLAAILLPTARISELNFILRSISHNDLYNLKAQGRFIYEKYFITVKHVANSMLSSISLNKLNFPPPSVENLGLNHINFERSIIDQTKNEEVSAEDISKAIEADNDQDLFNETLGPHDTPFKSLRYARNMSLSLTQLYSLWNNARYSPFETLPHYPFESANPSEYKYLYIDKGFRPINDGLGGSGVEFSQSLGGDYPNEQFTIVILTFERQSILMKTLQRLRGLSYLNKVIVVWNSYKQKPPSSFPWPKLDVPLLVILADKNSLNNRFIPFSEIETEAVLSLDDDSPLRQDELVFAFRVWRQSRDRIVGFPGRFHAFNKETGEWLYNSNHSCEISMVLTGGAFFHVYYMHQYTNNMAKAIRSIVDEFMNCEDIAMNFLVAHLTRKPPIKVTTRWTFHCPDCAKSLSNHESHFRKRNECLNTFASYYGYMPLLMTQHRSDSVLFKTKVPIGKQKCFKYV